MYVCTYRGAGLSRRYIRAIGISFLHVTHLLIGRGNCVCERKNLLINIRQNYVKFQIFFNCIFPNFPC